MEDSAITLHEPKISKSIEKNSAEIAEDVRLADAWKRACAYLLDMMAIYAIFAILTNGNYIIWMYNLGALTSGYFEAGIVILHWAFFVGGYWLYFKYTGIWLGRSLGQRWFRIALVHDDATPLGNTHWGPRAWSKTRYVIPIIGIFWYGINDVICIRSDQKHQSSIDKLHYTVAAIEWSLPITTRYNLR